MRRNDIVVPLKELGEAILGFPLVLFRLVAGVLHATLTDNEILLLTAASITIGFLTSALVGLAVYLSLYFVVRAVLVTHVAVLHEQAGEVNFLARCIRDRPLPKPPSYQPPPYE